MSPSDQLAPPPNHHLENPDPILMNAGALDKSILNQIQFLMPNPNPNIGFLPKTQQLIQMPPPLPHYPQYSHPQTPLLPQTSPNYMPQVITNSIIPPPTQVPVVVGQNAEGMNVFGSNGEASNKSNPNIAKRKQHVARNTSRNKQKAADKQPMLNEMDNNNQNSGASNDGASNEVKKKRQMKQPRNHSVRSSTYHGVTRYAEDRYEAFVWDNSDRSKKPRTVYIGGYDDEVSAARAYDLVALKVWGESAVLNFPISNYAKDLVEMQNRTKTEYFHNMRRKSKGFAKGASIYRGVSRNSDFKKWQSRIGKGKDIKGFYLGTFDSEKDAAKAYDMAAIKLKGENAITNFDINEYDVKGIIESQMLPIGKGASKLWSQFSVADIVRGRKRKFNTDENINIPFLHDPNVLLSDLEDPNKVHQLRMKHFLNSKNSLLHGLQSQVNPNGQLLQAANPPLFQGFINGSAGSGHMLGTNGNVLSFNSFNGGVGAQLTAPDQNQSFPLPHQYLLQQGYGQNPIFPTLSSYQKPLELKGKVHFEAGDYYSGTKFPTHHSAMPTAYGNLNTTGQSPWGSVQPTLSAVEGQDSSLTYLNQMNNNVTNQNGLLQTNVYPSMTSLVENEDNKTTGNVSNSNGAGAAMVEKPVGMSSLEEFDQEMASCFEALNELGPLSYL